MVLWVANRKVYGAHKLWKAARRAGHDIGRDQVARLMRELEHRGISRRRRKVFTTRADPDARAGTGPGEPQLHRRAARRLVGHRPDLRADPVGDGLRVLHRRRLLPPDRRLAGRRRTCAPRWSSTPSRWPGAHAAAAASSGWSPTPTPGRSSRRVRFTERLDEIGARPSIGTVADSYDNALAETTNGLYKTECVYGPDAPRPGTTSTSSSSPPSSWVHWFNEHRLHGHCGDVPPAEFEAAFYAAQQTDPDRGWKPIARASIRPRAVH